jgi:hypothetical protein
MFATAGGPSLADNPLTWSLFFARQPEPDLEFTEEELEQTSTVRSPSPVKPPKQPNKRPLLLVLFVLLLGGGAYLAMEPDMIMEYLGPLLGDAPAAQQPQPPVARKPVPPTPVPVPQATSPVAVTPPPSPAVAPVETPQAATPTPAPTAPSAPMASTPAPAPPTPASSPAPTSAPQTLATPAPLFSEGQRVSVAPNPAAPGQKVQLSQDAEGTKPGPAIPPGTVFTILDGDLQGSGWVYSVRSDFGTKGWLAEKQLKLKP